MSGEVVEEGAKSMKLEYLPPDEIERLKANCRRPEDKLLVDLMFITGARVSEVLSVRPMDIDYQTKRLDLPALKRKDVTRKFVAIYDDVLLEELREFTRSKPKDKPLFNISRQVVYMRLAMAGNRAGFDGRVHPHLLRHSMAIHWSKSGGNLQLLQRQLGHKKFATTVDMYQRFQTSDILEEAERIFSK
jgi:integrase